MYEGSGHCHVEWQILCHLSLWFHHHYFLIDEEAIIQRIKSRSVAENREDDDENVIETRIANYYKETKPLSDFYKNQYSSAYYVIDGNQEIQKLNTEILKIIKKT